MQIGKYKIRKETPNIVWHKHIRPLWDPRLRENNVWNNRFLVITNNFCNQSCYSCSALCNRPIGSNPFRWKLHVTPIESIAKFLDLIDGWRPKHWIRLSGGEVTLCAPEYVKEICELAHQHNRPISMLTNAARMELFDPHWFDFIHLDEHIVNEQKIYDTARQFKDSGFNRFQIWTTKEHRDLDFQRYDNVTKGLRCEAWLEAVTLWRDTVYPCCVLPFLDGWNGSPKIREALREYGWHIDNPDLVKTICDYPRTTAPHVAYACQLQCWKDGKNLRYQPVSCHSSDTTTTGLNT